MTNFSIETREDISRLILETLSERHDLYLAHCLCREMNPKPAYDVDRYIYFHAPFLGPVQLFVASGAAHLGVHPQDFEYAIRVLLTANRIARVEQKTLGSHHYPNDFRDAQIGDLFLHKPRLLQAYLRSVEINQIEEGELENGQDTTAEEA